MIAEDGGVTSFNFEFTEWSHQIQHLQKASGVMDNWVLGNSSHVWIVEEGTPQEILQLPKVANE